MLTGPSAEAGRHHHRRPGSPPSLERTWNFVRHRTRYVVDQTWSGSQPAQTMTCPGETDTGLDVLGKRRGVADGGLGLGLGSPPAGWQEDTQRDTFSQMPLWLLSPLMPGTKIYLPSPACVEIKTPGPGAGQDATSFAALALRLWSIALTLRGLPLL